MTEPSGKIESPARPLVVVGFDDTRSSSAALAWAADAAQRLDARLSVVWALPRTAAWTLAAMQVDFEKRLHRMREQVDEACRAYLEPRGLSYTERVVEGSPSAVLQSVAGDRDAILLVIGESRHGWLRDVAGGVAHDLVHAAPVPVVVVPSDWVAARDLRPSPARVPRRQARSRARAPVPRSL